MGQVIAFPFSLMPYSDLAADLDTAECVLLMAVRWWVVSRRGGQDPIPCLLQGLQPAGAGGAAYSIDRLMTVVDRVITRPIEIQLPRCPNISLDEKRLLWAASYMQAGERKSAEKVLRTTLLSVQGAEFAIGALEGLGELFAQAQLFLSRRSGGGGEKKIGDTREARLPPRTLH